MSTDNYDPTKDNNPVKTFKPSVNIPFLDNSNVNKKKYAKDIKTGPVSSKTALKKTAGKKTSAKKSSGTLSYEDSYTDAVKAKWANKGGKDAYIKAAKAYNTKKYGSTNPTADAKKAGMSKSELASKHKVDSTKFTESLTIGGKKTAVSDLDPKYTTVGVMAPSPIKTSNNTSIAKTTAAANSSDSLLGGVRSRREKRRQRQDTRLDNREARRSDRQEQRGSGRKKVVTAVQRKSNTPALDTGAGTYQGGPVKKKKTGGGEFWGKSGPIK